MRSSPFALMVTHAAIAPDASPPHAPTTTATTSPDIRFFSPFAAKQHALARSQLKVCAPFRTLSVRLHRNLSANGEIQVPVCCDPCQAHVLRRPVVEAVAELVRSRRRWSVANLEKIEGLVAGARRGGGEAGELGDVRGSLLPSRP